MPRGRTDSRNTTKTDYGANQTPIFEQTVVKRIEPSAALSHTPQAFIQPGDGRILIEKNKHKHLNASINQSLLEGMTPDQIAEALRAYTAAILRKPNQEEQLQHSGDSERTHRSRRSVFERIYNEKISKEKRQTDKSDNQDLQRKIEKEAEKAKVWAILELRDQIRQEEEVKLEDIIRQRIEEEQEAMVRSKRKRANLNMMRPYLWRKTKKNWFG